MDELMHYGIRGQRWGIIRKLKNNSTKNVTKNRSDDEVDRGTGLINNPNVKRQNRPRRADEVKSLSDLELQSAINRMNNEKRFIELRNELDKRYNPEKQTPRSVKNAIKRIASASIENAARDVGTSILKSEFLNSYTKLRKNMKKNMKKKQE